MSCLPFDTFLCWRMKIATMVLSIYIIISGSIACLTEILDIADQYSDSYNIKGGFRAEWRMHVWEGWVACNSVMVFCHLFMIAYSVLMCYAVKVFPTFYEYSLTRIFYFLLIIYWWVEMGTSLYKYSWYGPNIFRLPYLVFTFFYWILRACLNFTGILIVYSRIKELDYEIEYGEKKLLSPNYSREFLNSRSGYTTPDPNQSSYMRPMMA